MNKEPRSVPRGSFRSRQIPSHGSATAPAGGLTRQVLGRERTVKEAPTRSLKPPLPVLLAATSKDAERVPSEWSKSRATLHKSEQLSKSLIDAGMPHGLTLDPVPNTNLYWFAKLYEFITYEEISPRNINNLEWPSFLLHFIPIFYDMYYDAMQAFLGGRQVSKLWEEHFQFASQTYKEDLFQHEITKSIRTGVTAHIQGDMPEALFNAYQGYVKTYYANSRVQPPQFEDFHKDFFDRNKPVFSIVKGDLFTEIARITRGGYFIVGVGLLSVDALREVIASGETCPFIEGMSIDQIFLWRQNAWTAAKTRIDAVRGKK